MRCVLLIEFLAIMLSHAASVLLSERTIEQQQALEDIQNRMDHSWHAGEDFQ